ncbi:hypothetical protein [Janthinobacterium sp. RB2R34]|uniref:hypothetical protein n=1 Tax=Janthinobacterium sp. RB2R34 TaxID=3424193 RepID=UPI003F2692A3
MSSKIANSASPTVPRMVSHGIFSATVFAVALAAAGVCGAAPALNDTGSADDEIVQSKLVYVSDSMLFRVRLTESTLLKAGCTYVTENSEKNQKLRDILDKFPLHGEANNDAMVEPRYALYLARKGGTHETMLLDRAYTGAGSIYGRLDGTPVSAAPGLAREVVQWALDEKIRQINDQCVKSKSS